MLVIVRPSRGTKKLEVEEPRLRSVGWRPWVPRFFWIGFRSIHVWKEFLWYRTSV